MLQIINEEIEDYSKSIIVYKLTPTDLSTLFDILSGNVIYPDPDLEMFMVINISILYSEMVQFFAKSGYSSLVEWDKKGKINKTSRSL